MVGITIQQMYKMALNEKKQLETQLSEINEEKRHELQLMIKAAQQRIDLLKPEIEKNEPCKTEHPEKEAGTNPETGEETGTTKRRAKT